MSILHYSQEDKIAKTAARFHGSDGPGGIDADHLSSFLLRHGQASTELRSEMAMWVEWLSNDSPPYAAICGFNARRVAPLDKKPGVWQVHVGEAYMRL